jgi:hypothetical protein
MANPTTTSSNVSSAASSINFNAPNGWNQWIFLKNNIEGIQKPDSSLPYLYTPADAFWMKSLAIHCLIPWLNTFDAFTLFLLGGGASSSIIGSVGGLALVSQLFELSVKSQTMGIGRGAYPPSMGYCIGDKFKQQIYTRIDVQNTGLQQTIVTYSGIELLQNYKFKRAYVKQGEIVSFNNVASVTNNINGYVISLGIDKSTPPPTNISLSEKITITKAQTLTNPSSTFKVNILGVKSNWDIIISKPPEDIKVGDFYELSKSWCIEDPYLLSGFWTGREDDQSSSITSGLNLFVTTHTSPYQVGKFLGYYIWEPAPLLQTATTTTLATKNIPTTTTTTTTALLYYQPVVGYPMADANDFTWAFKGLGNTESQGPKVYPDEVRYREVKLEEPNAEGAIIEYIPRIQSEDKTYDALLKASNTTYVRVEISNGGARSRHNWFAPCLKGSYLNCNKKLYKILDHIEYNVIDVAIKSVDGTTTFDPKTNQNYTILNQYGWFINEHYDGRLTKANTGIFEGAITDIQFNNKTNNTIVTILSLGDTYISSGYKSNSLSFVNRYQNNLVFDNNDSLKKMYTKFEGWKLVSSKNEYEIVSIDFNSSKSFTGASSITNPTVYTPYPIKVTLKGNIGSLALKNDVYVSFDKTYTTVGGFGKESGYSFISTYKAGLTGSTNGLIISDSLCMNGEYVSNPYKLDITQSDRIGYCDGVYFGLSANGSAQSDYSQVILMSTPRANRGVASLFHNLRREDWVAYVDPVTQKLTIRKGSLQFTEYPKKELISVGLPIKQEIMKGTDVLELNADYLWIRRLTITFDSSDKSSNDLGFLFGIKDPNNIYGFYVSGDGLVDLQLWQKQNLQAGPTQTGTPLPSLMPASNAYQGEGYNVSPVYTYKPNYYQQLQDVIVDVGVKTDNNNIYVKGGKPKQVLADYVSDNQLIGSTGYFDLIRLSSGENILLYGSQKGAFNLVAQTNTSGTISTSVILNNSRTNNTAWTNSNAVMMLGTYDDNYVWNTPMKNRIDAPDNNKFVYPVMLLNSVDYLGCIYNERNNQLAIFVRSAQGDYSYLGCYIINVYRERQYARCSPIVKGTVSANNPPLDFLWSHPLIADNIAQDPNQSWTDTKNLVKDNYKYPNEENNGLYSDVFVRVMGPGQSHSQILNGQEFGIISTSLLNDGTYMVLFDTEVGIRAAFSNDNGHSWVAPNTLFAKDAISAILLASNVNNPLLAYISTGGIRVKIMSIMDFYNARNYAGKNAVSQEILLQESINSHKVISIGSGEVEPQRLSGYITPEGITKIFFYNQKGLLKCMESKDGDSWKVASNF